MARNSQIVFGLLGLIVLSSLAWGFYVSIEFYDEKVRDKWSNQALYNPYLAAEQFLQKSGVKVIEADSLIKLNSFENVNTILITNANQIGNPRQLDAVLGWLEGGGSLIVTANSFSTSDDLLLQKFEVDVSWPESDDAEDVPKNSVSDSLREYNEKIEEGMSAEQIAESTKREVSLTEIDFTGDIGLLKIAFSPKRILTHPYIDDEKANTETKPFSWSSSENGVHLIQFDVGEGLLTVISDPSIWQSRKIDQHDHAYLLWVLSSTDGIFAFMRSTNRESIWSLISTNAIELIIALSVFILSWLWFMGHRFGRIVPLFSTRQRALSEHFSATASYLWHRKATEHLLQPLRQQVFRRAHIAIPEFSRADEQQRLTLIAAHCQIDRETVNDIMLAGDFNDSGFVRTVKLLKQIEHPHDVSQKISINIVHRCFQRRVCY